MKEFFTNWKNNIATLMFGALIVLFTLLTWADSINVVTAAKISSGLQYSLISILQHGTLWHLFFNVAILFYLVYHAKQEGINEYAILGMIILFALLGNYIQAKAVVEEVGFGSLFVGVCGLSGGLMAGIIYIIGRKIENKKYKNLTDFVIIYILSIAPAGQTANIAHLVGSCFGLLTWQIETALNKTWIKEKVNRFAEWKGVFFGTWWWIFTSKTKDTFGTRFLVALKYGIAGLICVMIPIFIYSLIATAAEYPEQYNDIFGWGLKCLYVILMRGFIAFNRVDGYYYVKEIKFGTLLKEMITLKLFTKKIR